MLDVVIIGGGPGGLTAGLYASRGGLNTRLYELGLPGGQIITSSEVENYPGMPEVVTGTELMQNWPEQAKKFGVDIQMGKVEQVSKKGDIFSVQLDSKEVVETRAVILATGSVPRKAGFTNEDTFFGRGVSTCATCDGFFYKDQEVMVLGGGDTALEESIFLANICSKVYIVHRREEFRAAPITLERVKRLSNVEFLLNASIDEIYGGDSGMQGAKVKFKSGAITDYKVPVIFVFVGRDVLNQPIMDSNHQPICNIKGSGEVIVDLKMQTSLKGLYAIGDVRIDASKQVVCAAGDGATAAVNAIEYVQHFS